MADGELPAPIRANLGRIEEVLREVAAGTFSWQDVADELELMLANALALAGRAGLGLDTEADADADPVSIGQMVAGNVRLLRLGKGWTQAELAEGMRRLGFDWTRITARDMEAGGRRLQIEELFGLAVLLDEPVAEILAPQPRPITWAGGTIVEPESVGHLLLGHGGQFGRGGGPDWAPAALAGKPAPGQEGKVRRDVWRSARRATKR